MLISERYCNIFKSLFSDWPKAYSEFSKSAPGTSSSCRLYNYQGHSRSRVINICYLPAGRSVW